MPGGAQGACIRNGRVAMLAEGMSPSCKGNGGWYLSAAKGAISLSTRRWEGESFTVATPDGALRTGTWQHLVCLRAGGSLKVYLDGDEVASAVCPPGFRVPDYGDMNLGGTAWGNRCAGYTDEFAYYAAAPSPDIVREHHEAGARGTEH